MQIFASLAGGPRACIQMIGISATVLRQSTTTQNSNKIQQRTMLSPDSCESNSRVGLFLPEGPYIPKALPSSEVCYTHWCKEDRSAIIHQQPSTRARRWNLPNYTILDVYIIYIIHGHPPDSLDKKRQSMAAHLELLISHI